MSLDKDETFIYVGKIKMVHFYLHEKQQNSLSADALRHIGEDIFNLMMDRGIIADDDKVVIYNMNVDSKNRRKIMVVCVNHIKFQNIKFEMKTLCEVFTGFVKFTHEKMLKNEKTMVMRAIFKDNKIWGYQDLLIDLKEIALILDKYMRLPQPIIEDLEILLIESSKEIKPSS